VSEPVRPLVAEIVCIECRRIWIDGSERWRVLITADDPPETVAYCRDCAEREFDEPGFTGV
jgi:hypothetical protein